MTAVGKVELSRVLVAGHQLMLVRKSLQRFGTLKLVLELNGLNLAMVAISWGTVWIPVGILSLWEIKNVVVS
jgi:hypothetical protein